MKTNYLKNIFLVGSGIAIATSASIFASQAGTSIQANLVNLVQYLGELHITSDGTPNGDSVLSINGSGEFQQTRGMSQLVNTAGLGALGQTYPFVGAAASSGMIQVVAGVLADMVPILANQDASGSGMSSYIMAQGDRALLGFNADLTNQTDRVVELQVLDYGIVFRFPDGEYTFPLTAGTSGQVLTTDGSNELSWADMPGGSSHYNTLSLSYDFNSFNTQEGDPEIIFTGQLPAWSVPIYMIVKSNQAFVSDSLDEITSVRLSYNGIVMSNTVSIYQGQTTLSLTDTTRIYPMIDQPLDFQIEFSTLNGLANPQDRTAGQVQISIVYDTIDLPQ